MALRVLHLAGSAESPFMDELSRLYARGCLALTADVAEPVIAHVSPDGRWRFPDGLDDAAVARAPALGIGEAIERILAAGVDAVVPQMFCRPGMVAYRALWEVLGIPLLGNRAETMALTAHKARARAVVAAAGVDVPEGAVIADPDEPVALAPPLVVKPVDADNSTGVALVRDPVELGPALRAACAASTAGALVERYVPLGREVRCGLLDRDGELIALPLEEYRVGEAEKPIRDAADKLARDADGALGLVAKDERHAWILDPADPVSDRVAAAARRAYAALGCRHYGLFDFRIDPEGRPWFLEAGLYCSFARESVVATMARAAGIPEDELFRIVLDHAVHERISHATRPA